MVDSVTNMLLETLRDVLVEEVKFLWGVSDEVKKVERDLRTIHAMLMDADRKRSDSQSLRECLDELKELAIKAENVLETYAVEVESKKGGKSLKEKLGRLVGIFCECYSIHQVGNEIDDVRSRLADLTTKLQSINVREGSSDAEELQRLQRLRYAHEIEQHFVGMEKEIKLLLSMLEDEKRSVISICGMGGLGKTTLARKIYHHQYVQRRFDGRAWICVTQKFQPEIILRDIFKQVDESIRTDNMGLTELVVGIHNVLQQKTCLIVIDDIWQNEHWKILKPSFPTNCTIVLTTRSENVAYEDRHLLKLDFLSEDEGWELLANIAVLENQSKPFEDIGRQIVRKCGGLPLAISVIGGILRQKQKLGEWEKVSSNIDSYLKRGEGIGNDTGIKSVLDLSYDALPYYLKSCFLYLACFAEDQDINTEDLYLLWMGESLISLEEKGDCEGLRDVAERYLTELASRCMVQVEKNKKKDYFSCNKFTSCRLHDLMHDLCSSKGEEEKFLKRIDISKHQHLVHSSIDASVHRLAINIDIDDGDDVATGLNKCYVSEKFKDLKSLLVVCKNPMSRDSYYTERSIPFQNLINFENSKHLRILLLYLFEFEGGKLPSTVEKLIYLRYLSLRDCLVRELPEYVCELSYLQTLDLKVRNGFPIMLPNLFWKMRRLRHLFLPQNIEVIGGEKLRVDGMNELETLEGIDSKTACIAGIMNLTNLRKLIATIDGDMDSFSKIVEYMSSNQCPLRETHLVVRSCDFGSGEEDITLVKKMLMSPSLTTLTIINCKMQCGFPCYEQGMCHNLIVLIFYNLKIGGDGYVLEELGKYPKLQYLWLEKVEEQEVRTEVKFGANSFPELDYLSLHDLPSLTRWEVEEGAIPKLIKLEMIMCRNLEKLPDGLRFIQTLQQIRCVQMSAKFMSRTMKGGPDHANISHIPKIFIK